MSQISPCLPCVACQHVVKIENFTGKSNISGTAPLFMPPVENTRLLFWDRQRVNLSNQLKKIRSIRIAFLACGRWNDRVPLHREIMGAHVSLRSLCLAIRKFACQTSFANVTLLQPTGYVMHQQVSHSRIVRSAYTVFMCFVFISEQTATCATYSKNWWIFTVVPRFLILLKFYYQLMHKRIALKRSIKIYIKTVPTFSVHVPLHHINPLNAELNLICYLLALLKLTIFSTLAG